MQLNGFVSHCFLVIKSSRSAKPHKTRLKIEDGVHKLVEIRTRILQRYDNYSRNGRLGVRIA